MADQTQRAQKKTSPAVEAVPETNDAYAAQAQQLREGTPLSQVTPELAASEFTQMVNAINVARIEAGFQAAAVECPEKNAKWCLPDANCTARVTMDKNTRDAFSANRDSCGQNGID